MGSDPNNQHYPKYLMNIVIVSIYPPPIGGVSAHSSRLLDYLLEYKRRATFIDVSKPEADHDQVRNMSELLMFFYHSCDFQ